VTNFVPDFLNDLFLDAGENSLDLSLHYFEGLWAASFDSIFLDVLIEHHFIELSWVLFSNFVWQLTALRFDDISLARRRAVSLRVVTLSDACVDSLLVLPC